MPNRIVPASAQTRLIQAIRHEYPQLSHQEAHALSEIVIGEIGMRIARGEKAGFLRQDESGDTELVILGLEIVRKKRGGQR